MCKSLKVLDKITFRYRINTIFACEYSEDDRFSVITEEGVCIFGLCSNLDSTVPTMSFSRQFIPPAEYITSANLGIDVNTFMDELPKFDLYEAVLRLDISGQLNYSTPIKPKPVCAHWSPFRIISRSSCAVAVLTNLGSLNVYMSLLEFDREIFVPIANVSEQIVKHFSATWQNVENLTVASKFNELKRRSVEVFPIAFTWSHLISINKKLFCIMIVAHLNGVITAWRFDMKKANNSTEPQLHFMGSCDKMKRITTFHWKKANNTSALLIIGDLQGRAMMIPIKDITYDSLQFKNPIYLYRHSDNIAVGHISLYCIKDMHYIFIVKKSHLLVCLVNKKGKILDVGSFYAGNVQICGFEQLEKNVFHILTCTGILKEIKVGYKKRKLQVAWRVLPTPINWSFQKAHGFFQSPNRVYFGIFTMCCKISEVMRKKELVELHILMNLSKNPLHYLVKNRSRSLRNHWDCLEALRVDGLLVKQLPCYGLSAQNSYDCFSLYMLKVYLGVAYSSESMFYKFPYVFQYNIKHMDYIKEMLQLKLAMQRVTKLLLKKEPSKRLTTFQLQSLYMINSFLKEIALQDALETLLVRHCTLVKITKMIRDLNALRYPQMPRCFWCLETLTGVLCMEQHPDTRCCISLMQIGFGAGYKCKICKNLAHIKVAQEFHPVVCPYCDVPMERLNQTYPGKNEDELYPKITLKREHFCKDDCDTSVMELAEINELEAIEISSDSENEYEDYSSSEEITGAVNLLHEKLETYDDDLYIIEGGIHKKVDNLRIERQQQLNEEKMDDDDLYIIEREIHEKLNHLRIENQQLNEEKREETKNDDLYIIIEGEIHEKFDDLKIENQQHTEEETEVCESGEKRRKYEEDSSESEEEISGDIKKGNELEMYELDEETEDESDIEIEVSNRYEI